MEFSFRWVIALGGFLVDFMMLLMCVLSNCVWFYVWNVLKVVIHLGLPGCGEEM